MSLIYEPSMETRYISAKRTGFSRRRPGAWGGGTEAASVVDAALAAGLICIYVCTHTYIPTYIYVYTYIHIYIYIHLSIYLSIYIYI